MLTKPITFANVSLNADELHIVRGCIELGVQFYRERGDAESAAEVEAVLAQFPERATVDRAYAMRRPVSLFLMRDAIRGAYTIESRDDAGKFDIMARSVLTRKAAEAEALRLSQKMGIPAFYFDRNGNKKQLTKAAR